MLISIIFHQINEYARTREYGLSHNPFLDGAGPGGDVDADFDEGLAVLQFVREHIAFLVDLFQRVLGGTVNLELEDIYAVVGVADGVGSSDGGFDLGTDIESQQRENQVYDCLVVLLGLVLQIVRDSSEISL